MRKISIADMTIRESVMSFKEKLEAAKQLDKLGVDVIELPQIKDGKTDTLLIKTIAGLVKNSIVSGAVGMTVDSVNATWQAVSAAAKPRLQVTLPTSAVQMEYVCKKKPAQMLDMIAELVGACAKNCKDVEFVATDATRSEREFLYSAVKAAIEAGATVITLCDTAGIMIPDEMKAFVNDVKTAVPEIEKAVISVVCSDELQMANANSFAAAAIAGADQIKTTVVGIAAPSLETVAHTIDRRGDAYDIACGIKTTELQRAVKQISWY
ncbi:MAG: hypothetical protein IKK96_06720, partial [Lachnospiraceae bacterium]|nr:hypothetical protein [Lachnospiraceae bacterium]